MPSLYGQRTLESIVALSQSGDGLTLRGISDAIASPLSSAQRAMESIARDGLLIETSVGAQRRYAINRQHPAADTLVTFSLRALPPKRAIDLVVRSNPAVQFAGRDDRGYLVVLSPFADPVDIARTSDALGTINDSRPDRVPVVLMERRDVTDRVQGDPAFRERGLRLDPIIGSAIRVFRDPDEHGSLDAPGLGRLHPSLARPPARAMKDLARRHRLERLAVFGSAVRADFRPDSDVDVLVEPKAGARLGVADLIDIRRELESLFDRDVDVVNARSMRGEPRQHAEQEGVLLYGRS